MPLLIQLQILENVFPNIIADIVLSSLVASATILNTGDKTAKDNIGNNAKKNIF